MYTIDISKLFENSNPYGCSISIYQISNVFDKQKMISLTPD